MRAKVTSIDPRDGSVLSVVTDETTADALDAICAHALTAATALRHSTRAQRAAFLHAVAAALESNRDAIVAIAEQETALSEARLRSELARTAYQLRLFADVLIEGSYLSATIDHTAHTAMGVLPDLRSIQEPIGPVAVFGASNFPLAFSVPGGDTASALAAGCPVVVKAHSSHPATSMLCFEVMREALATAGAPDGTLGIVFGHHAGRHLVAHPTIRAVGFTGSLGGGRALADISAARPVPIPVYGELSSTNPLVITPGALAARSDSIARDLTASFTLGAGQFCTKPGLVFVPEGADSDRFLELVRDAVALVKPQTLLNESIRTSYRRYVDALESRSDVQTVIPIGLPAKADEYLVAAKVLLTSTKEFIPEQAEECFGPTTLLVLYRDTADLVETIGRLPGALTGSVHLTEKEVESFAPVVDALRGRVGRLVFNGYPTGVAVSWAQNHGGPWPSTNSLHSSVGPTAIGRFLRSIAWQDAPTDLLPTELQDRPIDIPRRIDGRLQMPQGTTDN